MLDLHLFLSRPLAPAPIRSLAEAAAAAADLDPTASVFGSFPQGALGDASERVREIVEASPELQSLSRSVRNAFSLYKRTRPQPSAESSHRSRYGV